MDAQAWNSNLFPRGENSKKVNRVQFKMGQEQNKTLK